MRRPWLPGCFVLLMGLLVALARAQDAAQVEFGGTYEALTERQKGLIADWVARFNEVTGQNVEAGAFYDEFVKLSTRTTFEAVTHALTTTPLTNGSGGSLGSALDLIEKVETVQGKSKGASGDHQFRMYAVLKERAVDTLYQSTEFKRGADNTVYHKGYPTSFRQQGGVPSIQISVSRDGRRADIDVDYRSSSFPLALLNGHLSSSNSDVRAGNNYEGHAARWSGFRNWWRSLFGARLKSDYESEVEDTSVQLPTSPRAGKKNIDEMMNDFLSAWLLEGDVMAALGYISERAYSCLAEEAGVPVDRGMAPFTLLTELKAAKQALGEHQSLEGLTVGMRLNYPELKLVDHDRHAQFVLYSVPDDVAVDFDCESRMELGDPKKGSREYGNYFGATFTIVGTQGKGHPVALLWARENDYWKIVSWESEPDREDLSAMSEPPEAQMTRIDADPGLVEAARDFLESWLLRKDYDRAFRYVSKKSYSCYNLLRSPDQPEAGSMEEAGRYVRENIERAGQLVGDRDDLANILGAVEPVHPAVRVMDHPSSGTFALSSVPDVAMEWADCAYRARGEGPRGDPPLEYGRAFGMNVRFKTLGGEAPVFRSLWSKEDGEWRIAAYDVERP